jgi:anti-sigma-K factor RskA
MTCEDAEISLGALVLGALEPGEREEVEAHVALCPRCSAALADLAPLPGLLNRVKVTPDELEGEGLSPAPLRVLDEALARVRDERVVPIRRQPTPNWQPVLAAAAAAIVAVAIGLAAWSQVHHAPQRVVAAASSPTSGVSANVVLTPTGSGTSLDLSLSGVRAGEHCELVAISHDGRREVTSTWVADYEGMASLTGSTGLSTADISQLEIVTTGGETILSLDVPA